MKREHCEYYSPCKDRSARPVKRLQAIRTAGMLCGLLVVGGCDAAYPGGTSDVHDATGTPNVQSEHRHMWMRVGESRFAVTLANTEAARAFDAMLPLTIDMADLNSNEKHAALPKPLPMTAVPAGTIHNGDIMLYGTDTLVVFYMTFNSSYSYTRLGRVSDAAGLARALGKGDVRIHFSKSRN